MTESESEELLKEADGLVPTRQWDQVGVAHAVAAEWDADGLEALAARVAELERE